MSQPIPLAEGWKATKCPFCWVNISTVGGGLTNHISKTPHCRSQQQQQLSFKLKYQQSMGSMLQAAHQNDTQAQNIGLMDHGPAPTQDEEWDQTHGLRASFASLSMEYCEVQANSDHHSEDNRDISEISEIDIHGASFKLPAEAVAGQDSDLEGEIDDEAGWTLPDDGQTIYDHMLAHEDAGKPHYPWTDFVEWEVVQFLSGCGLSRGSIDDFIKLRYVSHRFPYEAAT